jgi:MFS family permease
LTWVVTAYTLVFGGLMVFGGRLADTFGARARSSRAVRSRGSARR